MVCHDPTLGVKKGLRNTQEILGSMDVALRNHGDVVKRGLLMKQYLVTSGKEKGGSSDGRSWAHVGVKGHVQVIHAENLSVAW